MTNREWFKQAKLGLFLHWGLYSVLGGQWKNDESIYNYHGEWIQNRLQLPIREYEPLVGAFNPIFFNAEEWVKLAKDAGMEYIVITSKHHEGFALFHSKVDPFNVVDATPFKRDIIREMAEACKKHGVRLGLYYSQYVDWHEEHAGGWRADKDGPGKTWSNYWDFPTHDHKNYWIAWEKKLKHQLREILTEYGDIATLWCDTPYGKTEEESRIVYEYIKSVNPDVLVNTRVGNGYGDYTVMSDNEIPEEYMQPDVLAEAPITLNKTWGFKAIDQDWKSADEVLRIKKHLNDRGVNLLLNIGPDHLGRFPTGAVEVLRELARRRNEE